MDLSKLIEDLRERVDAVRIAGSPFSTLATPLGLPLTLGEVHEWYGGSDGDWLPPLTILIGLAIAAVESGKATHLCWIGRACWPCPLALLHHQRVLRASLFLDLPHDSARLWAIDLALRSSAAVGVIADGRGLTLAHTRRLQLAANIGGGLCLLARPGHERTAPSAASTRWTIEPCPSTSERPRWTVAAIRNKHRPGMDFRAEVEWDDASGLVHPPPVVARGEGIAAIA